MPAIAFMPYGCKLTTTDVWMAAQVELVHAVQTASRQYCHRQLTWARGLPLFKWVDADQGHEAVVEQILSELEAAQHPGAKSLGSSRQYRQKEMLQSKL
jgi:hypothetical protein